MKMKAILALTALAFAGCDEAPDTGTPPVASTPAAESPLIANTRQKDVGDVEATVDIELAPETENLPGISAEELRSQKGKLNMLTLEVAPPKPADLWFKILVKTTESFKDQPVALRAKLFREIVKGEREELLSFNTVLDEFAATHRRDPGGEYFPIEFRADAFQGLAELPESMLLFIEAEVVISPAGTPVAVVDPASYTGSAENTGTILSNAVRINYSAPAASEPPAEDAPEAVEPAIGLPTPGAPDAESAAPEVAPADEAPAAEESPAAEAPAAPAAEETPAESEAPAE